ncbi:hypothetical protein [Hathewaya proteolytica]|uniref:hypothetical protein n=1 Tax=Hathewaya proteolytica TaxID=29365 RepID=UPI001A9A3BF2|nr:hypothetical protein [Hathewaya proteolytica]
MAKKKDSHVLLGNNGRKLNQSMITLKGLEYIFSYYSILMCLACAKYNWWETEYRLIVASGKVVDQI